MIDTCWIMDIQGILSTEALTQYMYIHVRDAVQLHMDQRRMKLDGIGMLRVCIPRPLLTACFAKGSRIFRWLQQSGRAGLLSTAKSLFGWRSNTKFGHLIVVRAMVCRRRYRTTCCASRRMTLLITSFCIASMLGRFGSGASKTSICRWCEYLGPGDTLERWWCSERKRVPKCKRGGMDSLVMLTCWSLWKQRNVRMFGNLDKQLSGAQLRNYIREELKLWGQAGGARVNSVLE